MSDINKTMKFNLPKTEDDDIKTTLKEVYFSLEERGYEPINQLIGYILSADPTYITSHNEARNKIRKFEVDEIVEALLKEYLRG